ncbi:MAG: DUF1289 domain-containing protein [Alphaproteobacteria bacterium]|nr:DUF1289 domain-containing protein [Alphaproteobacteria bacterium]
MARPATDDIPSPCIGVCRLDAGGKYCLGCLREIAEIAAWPRADTAGRRAILAAIESRRKALRDRDPA